MAHMFFDHLDANHDGKLDKSEWMAREAEVPGPTLEVILSPQNLTAWSNLVSPLSKENRQTHY